jgi:hypothetical protein
MEMQVAALVYGAGVSVFQTDHQAGITGKPIFSPHGFLMKQVEPDGWR